MTSQKIQTSMAMANDEPLPKIVTTVFYVDPKHGRNYSFDVNQNMTMSHLKGILIVAANVSKLGLRIFHKQTEVEYTKYKDETLEELFPNLEKIEFVTLIDRSYRIQQEHEQLNLGKTCDIHPHKYCIFYCFDCEKSLCSLCIGGGDHQGHALSEKFDYLKPSDKIVDSLFSDLDGMIANVVKSSNKEKESEELKLRLRMDYFPSLIELLRKIELKLVEQIDNFNKHCTVNVKVVEENSTRLKESCIEGLDELKYQIDIENMLKDEGVFLHFDHKVKEMSQEKSRIIDDADKLHKIIKSFGYIKTRLESIYIEIKVFLEKYLNTSIYDEIKNSVEENKVKEINKNDIFLKLLSDFKKQKGRIISEAKRNSNTSNFITSALGNTVFNMNNTMTQNSKKNQGSGVKGLNDANDDSYINPGGVQGGHSNNTTKYGTILDSSNRNDNLNNTLSEGYNNFNINKDKNYSAGKDQSFVSESNILIDIDKIKNPEKLNWIIKPNEKESRIVLYMDGDNNIENKVTDRVIKFSALTHGITAFLPNMAAVNTGKLLYVSGGEIFSGEGSDIFLIYSPILHSLQRKENMPDKKYSHSLIYNIDQILSVGGYNSNTCEKYDIKTGKWTRLSNLISPERQKPILYVHNNFLYAFFGYSKGQYLNSVERVNLKNPKCKWENVPYNNEENIELGRIGAAIIANEDGTIYFIGGKNNSIHSTIIKFDFTSNSFSLCEFTLEEEAFFKESIFIKFKDGDHGLFNENINQLLKLNLN